jgi:DNA-binding ferritin-like protein
MQKLIINNNDAFRPAIREEINSEDMFYELYRKAQKILDEIMQNNSSQNNKINSQKSIGLNEEYKNNIIAFCGERGDGKTSAMLTFASALYNHTFYDEKKKDVNKDKYFSEPIVIDPSMFDDVHNIMDIVLAKLYKNFIEKSNEGINERGEKDYYSVRQDLLNCFEKVYRCVSLIGDPAKIKEHEFDYDGNIGKLSKLGESTTLKENLRELVDKYLSFMDKEGGCSKEKERKLIIAIDDLDLCNTNAYKMAEQIRKYLVIPNVVIIMALKIEQLEMCVVENNLSSYSNIGKDDKYYNIKEKSIVMAEKYISKLIPSVHRVYMPKLGDVNDIMVVNEGEKIEVEKNLNDQVTELIRRKTGMVFITKERGKNLIVPDTLREFVNLWNLLNSLDDVCKKENEVTKIDYKIMKNNIEQFREYIKNILVAKLPLDKRNIFNEVDFVYDKYLNKTVAEIIGKIIGENQSNNEVGNNLSNVINCFEKIEEGDYSNEIKNYIYIYRIMYACKLNTYKLNISISNENIGNDEKGTKLSEIKDNVNEYSNFVGYNIWGTSANGILPRVGTRTSAKSRDRFKIDLKILDNIISEKLGGIKVNINYENQSDEDKEQPAENEKQRGKEKIPMITDIDKNNDNIGIFKYWITISLVSEGEKYIIANNRYVSKKYYVSLDNYIAALSNLYALYDKVNFDMMGIDFKMFNKLITEFKDNNSEAVECAEYIVANPDCMVELKKYCTENSSVKDNPGGRKNTTALTIKKFFDNIVEFMNDTLGKKYEPDIFRYFRFSSECSDKLDIVELYKDLIENEEEIIDKTDESTEENDEEIKKENDRFKNILYDNSHTPRIEMENKFRGVVSSPRKAKSIRDNLLNMAYNIEYLRYHEHHNPELSWGTLLGEMCNLYSDTIKFQRKFAESNKETSDGKIDNSEAELSYRYKLIYALYENQIYKDYIKNKVK